MPKSNIFELKYLFAVLCYTRLFPGYCAVNHVPWCQRKLPETVDVLQSHHKDEKNLLSVFPSRRPTHDHECGLETQATA